MKDMLILILKLYMNQSTFVTNKQSEPRICSNTFDKLPRIGSLVWASQFPIKTFLLPDLESTNICLPR